MSTAQFDSQVSDDRRVNCASRRFFLGFALSSIPLVRLLGNLVRAKEAEYELSFAGTRDPVVITTFSDGSMTCRKGTEELVAKSDNGWTVFTGDLGTSCCVRRDSSYGIALDWLFIVERIGT